MSETWTSDEVKAVAWALYQSGLEHATTTLTEHQFGTKAACDEYVDGYLAAIKHARSGQETSEHE